MSFKKLTLKKGHEQSVTKRHLTIASGSVLSKSEDIKDGDIVTVLDVAGHILGCGHYQDHGQASVRILETNRSHLADNFWVSRLTNALDLRRDTGLNTTDNNCFRLVNSEGDLLPDLVVDIYNDCAVVQCQSIGMFRSLPQITEALQSVFNGKLKTMYCKSRNLVPGRYPVEEDFFLLGQHHGNVIRESSHQFNTNWVQVKNQGFMLDQRDNRQIAGFLAKGRRVFNAFCNSGGAFSIYTLAGQATNVVSIDGSIEALSQTEKNITLNGLSHQKHKGTKSNVNSWLKSVRPLSFDLGIIDPPPYAKSHVARQRATLSYKTLNTNALKAIARGGYLLTFSRSPAIDLYMFINIIHSAAVDSGRSIRIIKSLAPGADYPINLFHSGSEHLNGLLLRLD